MKKLTLLLTLLCFPFYLSAADLPSAEKLFEQGDFATALPLYQQLSSSAKGDTLYKVQLRIVACQFHMGEYLNAAKTMLSYPLPADNAWKARFLLYRIQTARQASNTYRRILETREIDDEQAQQDPEQWTRAQWQNRIQEDYQTLWALRNTLVQLPTAAETLILNVKDTDLQRIPTLFDFTVSEWLSNLPEKPTKTSQPRTFLDGYARLHPTAEKKGALRADILYTAYTMGGTNRAEAQIFWQTDYILLPFHHAEMFTFTNKEKAVQSALSALQTLHGAAASASWWDKVKGYAGQGHHYGRSYAAYEAAQLAYDNDLRAQALQICRYAQQTFGSSYYVQRCEELAEQITRPSFSFSTPEQPLRPEQPSLNATVRNLDDFHGRIYSMSYEELETFYKQRSRNSRITSWNFLSQLSDENIKTLLNGKKSYRTFSQKVTYKKQYFDEEITLSLPALTPGFYVVLTSAQKEFSPQKSPVYGTVLNLTDLAVFTTAAIEGNPDDYEWTLSSSPRTYQPRLFRFYTLNLKTGAPEPATQLQILLEQSQRQTLTTDENGQGALTRSISVGQHDYNSHAVHTLAQKNGHYAYTPQSVYFHFSVSAPVRLFVQTDRAIYRPGQTVEISVQAFQHVVRGTQVLPNTALSVKVNNASGDKIFTTRLTTNEMGTAQTKFTLPDDNPMLGSFSVDVSANVKGSTYHDYYSFEVEEYKRPDYEISLQEDALLSYGKTGTVTGHAQYYFGTPLTNATVNYTVTRAPYIPPFYWWWYRPMSEETLITQGKTQTDNKGDFSLTFKPEMISKDEPFARYRVKAEVLDESGRAIETTRTYTIGVHPHLFKVDFTQGFYDANKPLSSLATLDLTDTQGRSASGKVTLRVARLKDEPVVEKKNFRPYNSQKPPLEQWYKDAPALKTVFSQTYTFDKKGSQTIALPALEEGVYRLTLESSQAETQHLIFLVVKDGATLSLPAVALPQHATYYPGETSRILVGAAALKAPKYAELYTQGSFLLATRKLPQALSVFEYTVQPTDRGGIALRWFGVGQYQIFQADTTLEVPFDNKKLTVTLDNPEVAIPGQNALWTLLAKDKNGRPVNGQASVTVYDKSLDYYAAKTNPFDVGSFFTQNAVPGGFASSTPTGGTLVYSLYKENRKWIDLLQLPTLNLVMMRQMYKGVGRSRALGMVKMASVQFDAAPMAMEESAMAVADNGFTANAKSVTTTGAAEETQAQETPVRTDFAETAYFNTLIPVTNGKGTVRFKWPDSLTSWNILGYALTKDTDLGTFSAQTITRKDFMVRLQLPRFYREGDKGILQVAVTNLTARKLTVPVTITLRKGTSPANTLFGITNDTQTINVAPNETAFVSWAVTAPYAPEVYQITATGKTATVSDGEQKDFLVLPGTMRLLSTVNKPLREGNTSLTLNEVSQNPSAKAEIAAFSIHPSLALSVLNSMPQLLATPHNDLVSALHRYVPLAVVHQFYTTYPQLKEAVKKLPKRTGLTAPWNEKDPLRLTLLEQTPWTYQARGRQQNAADIINLFDDKTVGAQLEKSLKQIAQFQNSNGAFTWFAGGPDSEYLTLYALESFAQALAYKATIPQAQAKKAFDYIVPKIEKRMKEDKNGNEASVSFALYASYVLSAFPQEWAQYSKAKPYIKKWVDYADGASRFMTPLGQIYAAAVYHRLGDDIKANAYLDKVLARMKTNDLTGAYFAPEPQSWVWYRDTLTTQTVTLRTLLEIRPQAPQIEPMLQWLLFNRQTNEWSSKGAAQAVFTVLDVMQAKGFLSSPIRYTFQWAGQNKQLQFDPFDWTADLQFTQQGSAITPAAYTARVTKQGGATDFASLSVIYRAGKVDASPKGVINVERAYFVRFTENNTQKLRPLKPGETVKVGDEVEVHLTLTTDSAFEYVLLSDPKPAGFESADLHSGWTWNPVSMYRELRDAQTNFFINYLPAGKVTLRYVLRPTVPGQMNALPAQVQSMYAPEYGAHTETAAVNVAR